MIGSSRDTKFSDTVNDVFMFDQQKHLQPPSTRMIIILITLELGVRALALWGSNGLCIHCIRWFAMYCLHIIDRKYLHILNFHTVFLHMLTYAYIMNWSARDQPSTLYTRSFGIGEPSKLWGLLWKFRLPQQVCFVVVCNIALQDCKHEIWQVLNLPKHIEEVSGDLFCRKTHVHTSD